MPAPGRALRRRFYGPARFGCTGSPVRSHRAAFPTIRPGRRRFRLLAWPGASGSENSVMPGGKILFPVRCGPQVASNPCEARSRCSPSRYLQRTATRSGRHPKGRSVAKDGEAVAIASMAVSWQVRAGKFARPVSEANCKGRAPLVYRPLGRCRSSLLIKPDWDSACLADSRSAFNARDRAKRSKAAPSGFSGSTSIMVRSNSDDAAR